MSMDHGEREIRDLLALLDGDDDLLDALQRSLGPGGDPDETLVRLDREEDGNAPPHPAAIRPLLAEERLPFRPGAEGLLIELALIGVLSSDLRERLLERLQIEDAGTIGREETVELLAGLLREESLDRAGASRFTLRELGKIMTVQ
ncbi:MAG: hypothetical protein JW958_05950 [Candidatus Eisenbacteria bacterium]|nr:hypothetical protein [Candidatus Eisenbacteria bacterium]